MQIRDRIKSLRRVRAGDLIPHAKNWRTHPDSQRNALRGILAEVGYASALLTRELPEGGLQIVDGHLRAETTPDSLVPVLVLDITEAEAEKILLTHDSVSAMATTDREQVRELLTSCQFDNQQVNEMLRGLEQEAAQDDNFEDETNEIDIPELFQVVVECESVEDQQTMYERMRAEGYRCRVLTL